MAKFAEWLFVVIPVVLGLIVILVPTKKEDAKGHTRWRYILGACLLLYGLLAWWEQNNQDRQRDKAIRDTSEQVSVQVTKDVTKAVAEQYQAVIQNLTSQIGDLKGQLAAQGKDVSMIKASNIVSGKNPVKVEVTNPPRQPAAPPTNISWTQSQSSTSGKAAVIVKLSVDSSVNIPAFLATCDRPCNTSQAITAGVSMAQFLSSNSDNTVTGFVFSTPRPLTAGTRVTWTILSNDDQPINVLKVRLLPPTELPEQFR